MKKLFILFVLPFFIQQCLLADEIKEKVAEQEIIATDNKIVVVVQKQPLNENSNQTVILKKNWLGVYIQVNGKVKVNPLANTYEVE